MFPTKEIQDVLDLFDKIEKSNKPKIDGKALSCALRLSFYAGMKKKEISSVKISDLRYANGKIIGIDPGSSGRKERFIHLGPKLQANLKNSLGYISSIKKSATPANGPLFPGYAGESGEKKFGRHLKKFWNKSKPFDHIRNLGINNHEALFSKGQADRPTTQQFRLSAPSVNNAVNNQIQPAGKKSSISDKLKNVYEYLRVIQQANDTYISQMDEFIKEKNKLCDSIAAEASLDPGIKENLMRQNIAVVDKLTELHGPNFALISLPKKSTGISKVLGMVEPQDGPETIKKVLWLLETICVLPLSDLLEIERYRRLFNKTLSDLVCCGTNIHGPIWKNINHETVELDKLKEGETITREVREGFWNSFFDGFLKRNVVFTFRSGSISRTEEEEAPKPEDRRPIAQIVKEAVRVANCVMGSSDTDLISLLEKCSSDDLKPLDSYTTYLVDNFSFYSDLPSDHMESVKKIVTVLQQYSWKDGPYLGITELESYKEMLCHFADILQAIYDRDNDIAQIEHQVILRIFEYLWQDDSRGQVKDMLLKGVEHSKLASLLASAFLWRRTRPTVEDGKSPCPDSWEEMCEVIFQALDLWLQSYSGLRKNGSVEVLSCIVHIAMLRRLKSKKPEEKPSERNDIRVMRLIVGDEIQITTLRWRKKSKEVFEPQYGRGWVKLIPGWRGSLLPMIRSEIPIRDYPVPNRYRVEPIKIWRDTLRPMIIRDAHYYERLERKLSKEKVKELRLNLQLAQRGIMTELKFEQSLMRLMYPYRKTKEKRR